MLVLGVPASVHKPQKTSSPVAWWKVGMAVCDQVWCTKGLAVGEGCHSCCQFVRDKGKVRTQESGQIYTHIRNALELANSYGQPTWEPLQPRLPRQGGQPMSSDPRSALRPVHIMLHHHQCRSWWWWSTWNNKKKALCVGSRGYHWQMQGGIMAQHLV